MGFRFSRRIKVLPGVSVNLGKTGASVSVGGKGAKVTVNSRGVRKTVGIPGSGLSYSGFSSFKNNPGRESNRSASGSYESIKEVLLAAVVLFVILMIGVALGK
jgi:hypothetical protein